MFFCEVNKIFKNTFFLGTLLVAATKMAKPFKKFENAMNISILYFTFSH